MKELLKDLVAFKSFEPKAINACIDYIHAIFHQKRIPCEVLTNDGLKILVVTVGQGSKTLILNAHIDVVDSDPKLFTIKEEGDRLTGPGIWDMKGSAAAMIEILQEIDLKKLHSRLMLQFVPDEEVGGEKGTGYLAAKGYTGDFMVCCEPTNLKISVQSKGVVRAKVFIKGRAAHGSRPWLGENAILKAWEMEKQLQTLTFLKKSSPLFKSGTVSLVKIHGGHSPNTIPDSCEMQFDIRLLPEQSFDVVENEIRALVEKNGATVEFIMRGDPVVTQIDDPAVKQLASLCERHKVKSVIFGQDGSSDARFYTPLGVPGIEFGPSGGNQHSSIEYLEYSSLVTFKKILKDFVLEFGK